MWFWNTMRKYVEKKFMSLLDYIWCTSINLFDSWNVLWTLFLLVYFPCQSLVRKWVQTWDGLKKKDGEMLYWWDEKMRYIFGSKVVVARVVILFYYKCMLINVSQKCFCIQQTMHWKYLLVIIFCEKSI